MIMLPHLTNARQIQRNYRKLFDTVKKTKQPLIVMRNNKPDVAIIDYKQLQEMEAIIAALHSREEAKRGKAKMLKTSLIDLWDEAQRSDDS